MIVVTLAVSGCGRRGRLEPPPDPNHPFTVDVDHKDSQANRAGVQRRRKTPPIKAPNEPFILDPLL